MFTPTAGKTILCPIRSNEIHIPLSTHRNPSGNQGQRKSLSYLLESEGVKKLEAVDRPEGYLQNCRMRTLKMYGSWVSLSYRSYMVFNPYH
jgi:hypothetical protein